MSGKEQLLDLYAVHHEQLLRRYEAVMEACSLDGIVIFAGAPKPVFQDDVFYPFHISPMYLQWVPESDHAHSLLVLRCGQRPQLICHQPTDYWCVVPDEPVGIWSQHFEIATAATEDDVLDALPDDLSGFGLLGEPTDALVALGFQSINHDDVLNPLNFQRLYKSSYEIECIRHASLDAARGHLAARDAFFSGESEFGIHLAYLEAACHTDSQLPYANIVALNEHGSTLHYDAYDKVAPSRRRSFLIDAGASCNGYASDITRTWAAGEGLFADIVSALDTAQQRLLTRIRPGVSYIDLHVAMHRDIAQILIDAKLVRMSPDEMVEKGVTFPFFPHGLGHHLGLQVHDVAGKMASSSGDVIAQPEAHPFLRNLRPVEEGNVFTIEPGLYFIPQLLVDLKDRPEGRAVDWAAVEALVPFGGVRIEDDVVVTNDGIENLTRDAFAALSGA